MPSCARACDAPVASPSGKPVQIFHSVPPEYSTKRFSVPGASRVKQRRQPRGPEPADGVLGHDAERSARAQRAMQRDGMSANACCADELVGRQRP